MHFYVVYTRLGSPGTFVRIFTWCTLVWTPLGDTCMHFYVYTRLDFPGKHLYTFLRGVHSPGLHWVPFVGMVTWCTLAWTPLGGTCMHFDSCTLAWAPLETICVHFYVVCTRLCSPGDHVYAANRASQLTQLAGQPSHPANPATSSASSHPVTQPANPATSKPANRKPVDQGTIGWFLLP